MSKVLSRALAIGAFGLLVISSGTTSRPAKAQAGDQSVQVIEVTAKKYEFNPSPIHVKEGARVQLKITALDHKHGFKIGQYPDGASTTGTPGLAFSAFEDCWKIDKGQTVTIEFEAKTPGTYSFKCCNFCGFGHGGMKGELIVDP